MKNDSLSQLVEALLSNTNSSETTPDYRRKSKRNRLSRFQPFREEILRLWAMGKSLMAILNVLRHKHPDQMFPTSKSQLSRFIKRCFA